MSSPLKLPAIAKKTEDDGNGVNKPIVTSPKAAGKKSFVQLAHEAIIALKERTGSSQMAIQKYLLANHAALEDGKPFRTRVGMALKSGVTQKRFNKFKSSFKVNTDWVKKTKAKQRARDKTRKDNDRKKRELEKKVNLEKIVATKDEEPQCESKQTISQEESLKLKQIHDATLEKQLKKDTSEQLKKEQLERLKKRRFPMEDTKLHLEEKELVIKPPDDVKKRPGLPYVFQLIRDNKNTAETPSRCQYLDHGSRGLMPDLLQVYHFFRGDVHYCPTEEPLVPEFSLQQLMYAVDEILNGNAKKSRMVPPLISHLFVTCLKLLTTTPAQSDATIHERRLQKDLINLANGLSAASWGEICCQYMEALERFYTTSASVDVNVLNPRKTDLFYLMKVKSSPDLNEIDGSLPDGYAGYVGSPNSTLAKGHAKMMRHDPWILSGEEVMAILRALTDDILATRPDLAEDLAHRDEQMYELIKAKRTADLLFRKMRLAYEGPKQKSKAKPREEEKRDDDTKPDTNEENDETDGDKDVNKKESSKEWKATATKKQFESARKDQEKAHGAYEKAVCKLMARTDPVGFDRHHNRVYYFHHDPECLYIEMIRTPTGLATHLPLDLQMNRTSWHVIDNRSTFEQVAASLDIRGYRENDLYETLMGPPGAKKSLNRHLIDDMKEQNTIADRKKEREELDQKRQYAILACKQEEDGGGRRSGRFQSQNEIDLMQIVNKIEDLEKKIKQDEMPKGPDYFELTGMRIMKQFDSVSKRQTRRIREKKEASQFDFPAMPCSILWPTGNLDGTGVVGFIVSEILNVEGLCESLCAWQKVGHNRTRWLADLEEIVFLWCASSPPVLGPDGFDDPLFSVPTSSRPSLGASVKSTPGKRYPVESAISDGKRRRLESPASMMANGGQVTPTSIITALKHPLLELEERIYEVTGLAMAERDAGEADDNISTASDDEEEHQEKQMNLWKKKIFQIRNTPAKKYTFIRDILIDAIAVARKAQYPAIVAKLRAALLLQQPNSAGDCKIAALAVLQEYGGYNVDEENQEGDEIEVKDDEEEAVPSLLNTEAMMITGSLDGDDMANRLDWIEGVKDCKTLSRFAALVIAFSSKAIRRLERVKDESVALVHVLNGYEKEQERNNRSRGNVDTKAPTKKSYLHATEVWAHVHVTDEFCMIKLEGSPWWPARKCRAKDKDLRNRIISLDLEVFLVVGEEQDGGLRIVKSELVRKFLGQPIEEDLSEYTKSTRNQLDEYLAKSRRIIRGCEKTGGDSSFVEEKKTAK